MYLELVYGYTHMVCGAMYLERAPGTVRALDTERVQRKRRGNLAFEDASFHPSQDEWEVHQIIPNDEGGEAANRVVNYFLMHQ